MENKSQHPARDATDEAAEFRLLIDGATGFAIFTIDARGLVTTWNRGAGRLFGWAEAEILGRSCVKLYPPEDCESRFAADLSRAMMEGSFREEAWQLRKDGSEFLADVTTSALVSADRAPRGFAKVVHDATDRRAAAQAIEKRERLLQSVLATVPDAMIVIDRKGAMILFSAAAERLFGYREANMVGRNVSMLMPSPDRERHDGYLERYLATREAHIIGIGRIVTGMRADGSTFPMKLSVGEALGDDQHLFTGFIQDLTERREFEAQLQELKSELIHVSRLSAMGTMASTLAHELNQPLTAIASYAEALGSLADGPNQPDRELLGEIYADIAAQSLRAGAVVRRLREFVTRGDVSKTVADLPALINEASALALVGSREHGVTTRFEYDPRATPVLVDRVQIQQVVINLMRNAIEAMEDSPTRQLTVETSLLSSDTVLITVSDTGSGFAPEIEDKLFEAFATTKSEGMGLGLSICRTIVEAHGGRMTATSEPCGGARFDFTLIRPTPEDALAL